MRTQTTFSSPTKGDVQDEIVALMQDLPYDSLLMLREFSHFLRFQIQWRRTAQTNATQAVTFPDTPVPYPAVRVPPAQLLRLIGAFPPLGGDALADTEAIYEKD